MEDLSLKRQISVLSRRYLDVIMGDTVNTSLLLLQAPILAMLISLAYGDIGGGVLIELRQNQVRFALALAAVWCGTTNAAREICKERAIYLRERMVNLMIEPYILSKIVILLLLSLIQISVLLGMTIWLLPANVVQGDAVIMFFVLMLISLTGITLGLLISSAVNNPDRAITLVPVVLMPQILFSGTSIPLEQMGSWSEYVSHFMVIKWGIKVLDKLSEHDVLSLDFGTGIIALIAFVLVFYVLSMQVLNLKEVSLRKTTAPRKVPVQESVVCSVCSRKIMTGRTECPQCGTVFHMQCIANFCPVCGASTGGRPTFRKVKSDAMCALDGKPIKGGGMMCPYCESVFHEEDVQGLDKCPVCGN